MLTTWQHTQSESYARPTALYNTDSASLEHSSRLPQMAAADPSFMLGANPSPFTALSSVAMDELYALERAEALRRAEYEIRHSEALRRAEYESRHAEILSIHGRVSKSASTTPMMTPFYPPQGAGAGEDAGYFGGVPALPRDRDPDFHAASAMSRQQHPVDDGHNPLPLNKRGRRLSATSLRRDQALPHPYSMSNSSHAVDARGLPHPYPHSHPHSQHPSWPHPHHHHHASSQAHRSHHPHPHGGGSGHEDCPSPASSDSDSLVPMHSPTRASAMHAPVAGYPLDHAGAPGVYGGARTPGGDASFTPSTSPFLGGLRKLNIHSAVPSRAPSPFHLPPSGLGLDSPLDGYPPHAHHHHHHRLDSPPTSGAKLGGRKRNSTGDLVSLAPHHTSSGGYGGGIGGGLHGPFPPYSSERNAAYLPTPQLSSGPSSSGSSPRSYANSLYNGAGPGVVGGGSLSASSSRAPSPPHWAQPAQKVPPALVNGGGHGRGGDHAQHSHHHLAHSVRAAFGMTPIHPRQRPMSSGFPPHGASSATFSPPSGHAELSASGMQSVPGSRASSPPIRLPPLKLPSLPSSPNHRPGTIGGGLQSLLNSDEGSRGGVETIGAPERIELPRFSEVEAATGLR